MTRWVFCTLSFLLVFPFELRAELSEAEQQADAAFQRGVRLYEAEDYMAAAQEFERAFSIVPIQSVHYNIARSYELAELPQRAAQHYRAFIDARAGNPERRAEVRERLERLSQGLSWVSVTTEPEGAMLSVDGDERGLSPAILAVTPGRHDIEARYEDLSATRTVNVESEEISISIALDGTESSEPVAFSGSSHSSSPSTDQEPDPSQETEEPIPAQPRSIRRLHHGFFWAGLGLTLSSGIALAVVGMNLVEKRDEYNALPANDPREEELRAQGQQLEVATTALWITTGVLALATVMFAIFTDWGRLRRNRDRGEASRSHWALGLGQGLSVVATF